MLVAEGVKVFVGVDVKLGVGVAVGVFVNVGVGDGVKVGVGVVDGVKDAVGVGIEIGGDTLIVLEERKFSIIPSRTVVRCTYGQTLIKKGVINGWLKSTPIATRSLGPPGSSLGFTPQ